MLFLLFLLNVHSVIILLLLKANCSFSSMGINMGIFNTEEPTVNATHLSDNISTFHLSANTSGNWTGQSILKLRVGFHY